jgi:transporter family protein
MNELFKNPIFLALLSALSASLMTIFAKIGLRDIDPMILLLIRTVLSAIILGIFLIGVGKVGPAASIEWDTKSLLFVLLSTLASVASLIFYFYALQKGQVTTVSAVDKLSIVFILIFSAMFLGNEQLTLQKIGGVVLTVVGTVLLIL